CSVAAPFPLLCGRVNTRSPASRVAISRNCSAVPSVLPSTTTQTGFQWERASRTVSTTFSPVLPGRVNPTKLLDASGRLDHLPRTPVVSGTHLVLIPSYDTGEKVVETVRDARSHWNSVWVVVDGSTDGTAEQLCEMATRDAGLRVFTLP